jgi:signal peptidase I
MTNNTSSHRRRLRPSRGGDRPRGFGIFLRDILVIFVVALLISFLVKTYLIRSFYIPSGSMENTLQIDDRIIVNELVPDLVDVRRGDVIVFTDPGGWLDGTTPVTTASGNPVTDGAAWFLTQIGLGTRDSNDHLIKRVIGCPATRSRAATTSGRCPSTASRSRSRTS